jgi:hypothetical protein
VLRLEALGHPLEERSDLLVCHDWRAGSHACM